MRDEGLQHAIQAAGGISALARLLGVSQPSISIWTRVPAERVLAVESVTSVSRSVLRPDLYPSGDETLESALDPIDDARARLYLLLGNLILGVPDESVLIDLRQMQGDETALGQAISALAESADVRLSEKITREHFDLFIGVGRGELLPFSSYYLTGFLYERPLVRMRQDLRRLGLERDETHSEPEDHIGFILEVMAGIVSRRFMAEPQEEKRFFLRHIQPWAATFFADLEKAEAAQFYKAVGRLGSEFMRIEREAFALDEEEVDLTDSFEIANASVSQGARA